MGSGIKVDPGGGRAKVGGAQVQGARGCDELCSTAPRRLERVLLSDGTQTLITRACGDDSGSASCVSQSMGVSACGAHRGEGSARSGNISACDGPSLGRRPAAMHGRISAA
eukprot:5335766-Amphidinium_carterae.1